MLPEPTSPLPAPTPCRRRVVQQQKALVVLLVDLLDASGSILGRVRDLVGAYWGGGRFACLPSICRPGRVGRRRAVPPMAAQMGLVSFRCCEPRHAADAPHCWSAHPPVPHVLPVSPVLPACRQQPHHAGGHQGRPAASWHRPRGSRRLAAGRGRLQAHHSRLGAPGGCCAVLSHTATQQHSMPDPACCQCFACASANPLPPTAHHPPTPTCPAPGLRLHLRVP